MRTHLIIGAAAAAFLAAPALAYGPAEPTIEALDTPAWSPATVTITAGESVTFRSQSTKQPHDLHFEDGAPSCTGVQTAPRYPPQPWSGSCTFTKAGDYAFFCSVHDIPPYSTMRGTVHVVAAPTPSASPDPSATPQPGASPTPGPGGSAPPSSQPQRTLALKLAARQKGTRVRGQVDVLRAGSRLEVTLTARLDRRRVRVGRTVKPSTTAGRVAFSVRLDAKARRALRSRRRLEVTVAVALTPPGGAKLTRSKKVRLRG